MRLGLNLGYWGSGNDADNLELAKEADALGFSVAWAAEAYGSDAATVLTWVAAHTSRMDVGSAIFQIPARSAAMTAMTAATLDTLSGGRFRLGLGVSGPQVSEGWHGVRYAKPLGRTREYVDVVKKALAREKLTYDGDHIALPLPDGPGKALHLTVRPVRDDMPIYIAAVGPKNLELTGEMVDGWHAIFFSPSQAELSLSHLRAGRQKAGRTMEGFDVNASVPVGFGEDLQACAAPVRGYAALYVGGMGSREKNFYNDLAHRLGYGEAADQVQDLFLSGEKAEAMGAVPFDFLDETSLLGPKERVAEKMAALAAAGVTTCSLFSFAGTLEQRRAELRTAVEALELSGVGD